MYELGLEIKAQIQLETGIPVSVGVAVNKTLAKVANELVKKDNKLSLKGMEPKFGGCLVLGNNRTPQQMDLFLAGLDVGDVWGVGRRYAKKFERFGILTAKDLKNANLDWIQSQSNTLGRQMVMELRGQKCFPLELNPVPKKSIVSSRSFGEPITTLEELSQAVAAHASKLGEKLRKQEGLTQNISVFIMNNRFGSGEVNRNGRATENYSNYLSFVGSHPEKPIVDSFLAVLQTKFFHCQGDPVTNNDYVTALIGKDYQEQQTANTSTGGVGGEGSSRSVSKALDYKILPWHFDQLAKGGAFNNNKVEAYVYQSGRIWTKNKDNFGLVVFDQEV